MIAFVGAGRVGTALGIYFVKKGVPVTGYYSRSYHSAELSAAKTRTKPYRELESLIHDSEFIWITTNDDAIKEVADTISKLNIHKKKIFIHASGSITSDVLKPLHDFGHLICSVHPLLAFNDEDNAVNMLDKTVFFAEGEPDAIVEMVKFSQKTGNSFIEIDSNQKVAYHAAAVMMSNYLVTLVDASNKLLSQINIEPEVLRQASNILLQSVLKNLEHKTPAEALTGPIKRGDTGTIRSHLEMLDNEFPKLKKLYMSLGEATVEMLDDKKLKTLFDHE